MLHSHLTLAQLHQRPCKRTPLNGEVSNMLILRPRVYHGHSFISGMHHYECVAPKVDIILQSGRFWAMSIASFREKFDDSRSCWVVFIHIVWGRPGGLQFSKGEAVKICLASDSSGIHTMWLNRERSRAWIVAQISGCSVFRLTSSFRTWWYHLIPNSLRRHHWSRASILCTSLLVTAQHSEPYTKMGRMQVLHALTWWIWRFVTSISDCPGSA